MTYVFFMYSVSLMIHRKPKYDQKLLPVSRFISYLNNYEMDNYVMLKF